MNLRIFIPLLLCKFITAKDEECWTSEWYNVTDRGFDIVSQPDFDDPDSVYKCNQSRCIFISTVTSDYVIELEEHYFCLEYTGNCDYDSLTLYDSNGFSNFMDKYCGSKGPDTQYSSGRHMLLHFKTDISRTFRGFKFYASSIHKDDLPEEDLSIFAILCILGACILVLLVIFSISTYIKQRCSSERTSGAIQPSINEGRTMSNPLYGQSNGDPMQLGTLNNSSENTTSYRMTPDTDHFYALPTYNEVTNNNNIYPLNNTSQEVNSEQQQGINNPALVADEDNRQSPPSYEEVIQRNTESAEVRTEQEVTENNNSQPTLALQIPDRNTDQSDYATYPVSPPPAYQP